MDDLIKASDISLQDMINYYLYGKKEKPASAEDYENALRPEATSESFYGKTLLIDAKDFMANGPGKYANISQVPLIQLLFGYADGDRQAYDAFVDKYLGNGKVLTISDLLANDYGESQIQTTVAQYTMDASNDDYTTRAYIWSTENFRLNGDATIQLIAGKIVISNLYLRPYNDDFDYISNSKTVQLSNPISMTVVDPYAIGRAVNIIFENKDSITPKTYGLENYEADVDRWAVQHDGSLFSAFTSVFLAGNAYLSEFVTGYELADGGKVIYGSSGDNVIDAVNGYYNLLLEQGLGEGKIAWRAIDSDPNITYSHSAISGDNQTVVVSGSGIDRITTGTGNDLIFSGAGEDHAFLNGGIDSVSLGSENDLAEINVSSAEASYSVIDGGDGFDRVRYTIHPSLGDLSGQNLQREGVTISDFHGTDVNSKPAISATVSNNMSGRSGTDTLISIEKLELTERADTLVVSTNGLTLALTVDMGKSGRVQSELHDGEILDDDAFTVDVDVADYSGVDHGLIYINGSTHYHNPVGAAGAVVQIKGKDQELEAIEDYDANGTLGYNDALHVDGADYVKLTSGDDVVINAAIGTIIATGGGNDKIWFTNGIAINDLSAVDRITFGSALTLLGGLRDANSEDQRAFGSFGFSYGLNDSGELVISNDFWKVTTVNADGTTSTDAATMYVLNWKDSYLPRSDGMGGTGAGNIFLAEYSITSSRLMDLQNKDLGHASVLGAGVFDILGLALKTMDGTATYGGEDPLVLDLNGNGLEITSIDYAKAKFDTDDDLYAESTALVGKNDGVLARDLNHNGRIDGGGELFGRAGLTGFSALASLDGNDDGVIDATDSGLADFDGDGDIDADDTFSGLLIWQDANENHQSDVGELSSVGTRGIVSISLPTSNTVGYSVNGSTVNQTSSFTTADGSSHLIGEVSLKIENQNTNYIGAPIAVSASVADFADLKGYGTLVSLRQSLSTSAANEALARTAIGSLTDPNLNVLRQAIQPILTAWAAGSPIKINGQVVTGQTSAALDDVVVVRDQNQSLVDYIYGFGNESGNIKHFVGEGNVGSQYDFASGVVISVGGGAPAALGRADVLTAISGWLYNNASSTTVTQGTSLDTQGNNTSFVQYTRPDGSFVRVYNAGNAAWSRSLVSESNHVLTSNVSFGLITSAEFGFYERLIGESMDSFFKAPSSTGAGIGALNTLLAKMDQTLNLFAVRLAVQSGPLSHIFQSIQYSADTDGFTSKSGTQLTAVFKALLSDAGTTSDPASWLEQWKPFFDVFLSDYSRGNSAQQNTYGFLVQDMLAAVESTAGGITLETFAHSFGIPDNLIVHNNGDVVGTGDADIIVIDGGETSVTGGSGADNYIIGKNFQSVSILDQDAFLGVSVDTLRFSAHNANDIDANRDGADLLLTDKATGATLRIVNEFEGRWPGPTISDASYDYGVNQIIFADGSLWNKTAIAEAVSKIDDASTTVVGTEDVDVLQGGKGDDLLEGGGDTDIYRYSRGDGVDTIADVENNAFRNDQDMLQFIGGIRLGDLTFERNGNSNDLKIRIKGEPLDSVTLSGQFNATYTGIYGTWYMNRIELITFDNGISLTSDQVAQLVISQYSTSGDDTIYGMDREDFLSGGKGDDFLAGGNQNDTYAFSKGDGHDIIQDGMGNIISGDFDVLQFGVTIHASDITFSRISSSLDTLVLNVGGTEDTVTLSNEFNYTETGIFGEIFWDRVEEVRFTDGSGVVWTSEQIAQMAIDAETTAGDDHVYGFSTNNVLDGGTGDDILEGRGGDDTYIFGRGYGHDTIIDDVGLSVLAPYYDTLIFKDLNFADVDVSRAVNSLTFTIRDTGETVTMQDQYVRAWAGGDSWGAVDAFVFKDQTFSFADFAPSKLPVIGTSAGEIINGSEYGETIDGKGGDDVLFGYGGGDVYIFGLGYGRDTVVDGTGYAGFASYDYVHFNADVKLSDFTLSIVDRNLLFSHLNGQDSLTIVDQFRYGWLKVEEFDFADGTILTSDQVLEMVTTHRSTSANEDFAGSALGDTYIYSRGGGNDSIDESGIYGSPTDKLILTNVNANEIVLVRNGNDVTLEIGESSLGAKDGGSVLLQAEFYGKFEEGVEQIVFADGTVWTAQTMRDMLLTSSASDENFVGFETNDTYFYSRGGGRDTIDESAIYSGDSDRLVLTDINSNQVSLIRLGNDVTLKIGDSAPGANDGGSITLIAEFLGKFGEGIEQVVFADGTIWTADTMRDAVLTSTAADENFIGFETSDTYRYSRGGGNDSIDETQIITGSADKLILTDINPDAVSLTRNGNDVTLIIAASSSGGDGGSILLKGELNNAWSMGVEQIVFADGTIWTAEIVAEKLVDRDSTDGDDRITGTTESNILRGGQGDDIVNGGGGNDIYLYARGDGNDTIYEDAWSGDRDRLKFSEINRSDVRFAYSGNDLTVNIAESVSGTNDGGSVLLSGSLNDDSQVGVEEIAFADGTTLSRAEIREILLTSTSANDTLQGFSRDDAFTYARGGGNDVYTDGTWSGTDTLRLTNIDPEDIVITASGNDVIVTIKASAAGATDGGSVTLKDSLNDYNSTGIEYIAFANGTTWSRADMHAQLLAAIQTSGNDKIFGFNTSDTLNGGLGDDIINGDGGNDTYLYSRGDGNDVVNEGAWSGTDTLQFININLSDVNFTQSDNDLTVHVAESSVGAGDGGSILLTSSVNDGSQVGVEQVAFADGTVMNRDQIHSLLLTSKPADETLTGFGGSDTFTYARGGGNDVMVEGQWSGGGDTLKFIDINPGDVKVSINGNDFVLLIAESSLNAGDGGTVTLRNSVNDNNQEGLEYVTFANGSTWSRTTMRNQSLDDASTDGNDTIYAFNSDDTLAGGRGDDILNGYGGNDTYIYSRGDGNDIVNEGEWSGGNDALQFTDINQDQVTFTYSGNDVIAHVAESIRGAGDGGTIALINSAGEANSAGIEGIVFANGTRLSRSELRDLVLTSTPADEKFTGFGGNDTYRYARGGGSDTIIEGQWSGNDTLFLTDINADQVELSANGGDIIVQVAESQTGANDGGNITLKNSVSDNYSEGVEYIRFADGTTWSRSDFQVQLNALAGAHHDIVGTTGDDGLIGTSRSDTIDGGLGNDSIDGRAGDDILYGQEGDDVLNGGEGADTLYGQDGSDILNGGAGNDFLDGGMGDDTYIVDSLDDAVVEGKNAGTDTVKTDLASYSLASLTNVENLVYTGSSAFTGSGNDAANVIIGGSGNDTIDGGSAGDDVLNGGSGDDVLIGSIGNDTENGGDGDDILYGHEGDDMLDGSDGADTLYGQEGNDVLNGGAGNDFLDGGTGDDTYIVDSLSDTVAEGNDAGVDTVKTDLANYSLASVANVENLVYTGSAAFTGVGNDADNVITGGAGNDTLDGGSAGDDILSGRSGDDVLIGGIGNDTEDGGDGDDVLYGQEGDDALSGSDGADTLYGQEGNDLLNGGAGNDYLDGGEGNDTLTGGLGADTFGLAFNGSLDTLTDFSPNLGDIILFDRASFGIPTDATVADYVTLGSASPNAGHGYILANSTGIYWDADGSNAGAAIKIADFQTAPTEMSLSSFALA